MSVPNPNLSPNQRVGVRSVTARVGLRATFCAYLCFGLGCRDACLLRFGSVAQGLFLQVGLGLGLRFRLRLGSGLGLGSWSGGAVSSSVKASNWA